MAIIRNILFLLFFVGFIALLFFFAGTFLLVGLLFLPFMLIGGVKINKFTTSEPEDKKSPEKNAPEKTKTILDADFKRVE